ncbi:MAG: hypothetical protein DMD55_17900, partial [Gemmatimonadetes bacterium]
QTFSGAARALASLGLSYLHVVEPAPGSRAFDPSAPRTLAAIRAAFHGTLVVNSGFTASIAEAALVRREADLVSFGVLFLANPDLVERVRLGAPLNEPDRPTFYGGDARGYTDYPTYRPAAEDVDATTRKRRVPA